MESSRVVGKIGARTRKDLAHIHTSSQVTPGIRDYVNSIVSSKETPVLSYDEGKQTGLLSNMDLILQNGILQQDLYAPRVFSPSNGVVGDLRFKS